MKKVNLILGAAVLIGLVSCQDKKSQKETTEANSNAFKVETTLAEKNRSEVRLNYSGTVEPSLAIPLSFQSAGTIMKIRVDEGDFVRKGQVLAELDNTSSQSAYNAALAMQMQAQDAHDRLKAVYDNGSLPEIKWVEMKSNLEQANSSEQVAKQNLSNSILRAPSAGLIGTRNIEVGENALPGTTVMKVVTINPVHVKISVPENEINKIKKGMFATVKVPAIGRKTFQGKVMKVGVMANQVSKTYAVKIELPNKNQEIKPGMVCDVDLPVEFTQSLVTIPYQSIVTDSDEQTFVYIIDKKSSTAVKHLVQLGEFINNQIQVLSGVSEGDMVIINGQHKIIDNGPITF